MSESVAAGKAHPRDIIENAPGPNTSRERAGGGPRASVVVPTYARPARLAALLESLARQSLAADAFEVVVVDDGSPEGSRPPAPSAGGNVRLLRQANAGPAAARNAGAAAARAPLLAFIDDDCRAGPGWLEAVLAAHAISPHALLGGRTRNGLPGNAFSTAAESLLEFFDDEDRRAGRAPAFVASNNIACARADFESVGGFDTSYPLAAGEDRAFCRAWLASGRPIERVAAAEVVHFHALDRAGFWRQQRNYGRGAARFHATAPENSDDGSGVAPQDASPEAPAKRTNASAFEGAGFYLRLLLHPLARRELSPSRRLAGVGLTTMSQLAITAGLLHERGILRDEARR